MSGGDNPRFFTVAVLVGLLFGGAELYGGYASKAFDALRLQAKASGKGSPKGSGGGGGGTPTTNPVYSEDSAIPSNFDVAAELTRAQVTANRNGTSSTGVFRLNCAAGEITRDDPVVYPGQPGKAFLRQNFGNSSATAASNYASLRTSGTSTCMSRVERSHYSLPAMLDGRGNVVRPDYVALTFERTAAVDPKCHPEQDSGAIGICIPFPNGLRFSFGFDFQRPDAQPTGNLRFACQGATAGTGEYASLEQALSNCPGKPSGGSYNRLEAMIDAPSCWDGKNLDSADHRSHTAYPVKGWLGGEQCPSTHPYHIPSMRLVVWYTVDESIPNWRFASDEAVTGARPGSTFQANWFGAWDNQVMATWLDNCINKKLDCPAGNLGNGKQIRPYAGFSLTASPRLTPMPGAPLLKTLASEGDSISVTWGGNHTGIYAQLRQGAVTHCGLAVGGSTLDSMTARSSGVANCNPGVLTVLIGANDLANVTTNPTTQDWLNKLWAYTDSFRAKGIKVAVGTILPQYSSNATYNVTFSTRRAEANKAIRAAVGTRVDAVIDFAADPVMGPDSAAQDLNLYKDGIHPTDGCGLGCGGQGKLASVYAPAVDRLMGIQ